jgi:hypothetical protein
MGKFGLESQRGVSSQKGVFLMDVSMRRDVIDPNVINSYRRDHGILKPRSKRGLLQHELDTANEILGLSTSPIVVVMGSRPRHFFELHHDFLDIVTEIKLPLHRDDALFGNSVGAAVALVYKDAADQRSNTASQVAFFVPHPEAFARVSAYRATPACHAYLAVERFLDVAAILAYDYCARPAYLSSASAYYTQIMEGTISPFSTFTMPLGELSATIVPTFFADRSKTLQPLRAWLLGTKRFDNEAIHMILDALHSLHPSPCVTLLTIKAEKQLDLLLEKGHQARLIEHTFQVQWESDIVIRVLRTPVHKARFERVMGRPPSITIRARQADILAEMCSDLQITPPKPKAKKNGKKTKERKAAKTRPKPAINAKVGRATARRVAKDIKEDTEEEIEEDSD